MLIHSNGTDARLDILQEGNFAITSSSITAYTAVAGDNLLIDTQAAQVTITLPASPAMGDEVSIMDVSPSGGFGTNKVTVNRNSQPIRGAASNLELTEGSPTVINIPLNQKQGVSASSGATSSKEESQPIPNIPSFDFANTSIVMAESMFNLTGDA